MFLKGREYDRSSGQQVPVGVLLPRMFGVVVFQQVEGLPQFKTKQGALVPALLNLSVELVDA